MLRKYKHCSRHTIPKRCLSKEKRMRPMVLTACDVLRSPIDPRRPTFGYQIGERPPKLVKFPAFRLAPLQLPNSPLFHKDTTCLGSPSTGWFRIRRPNFNVEPLVPLKISSGRQIKLASVAVVILRFSLDASPWKYQTTSCPRECCNDCWCSQL